MAQYNDGLGCICCKYFMRQLLYVHSRLFFFFFFPDSSPRWGTVGAEIKVPLAENVGLSRVPRVKPGLSISK